MIRTSLIKSNDRGSKRSYLNRRRSAYNEKKVVCPTILFLLGCLMIMTLERDKDIFDRERDENAKEYGAAAN